MTEPGVNVKEGDYLVAINGRALHTPQTPDELLVNTANEVVTLTVNSKPAADGARKVAVKPIGDEYSLHQLNMIETNRKRVDAASGGRIGYVYLPDMSEAGLNEFVKQYFPQIRKEGIIFDVRYNGGGFVDQLIFERLRRVLAGMTAPRNWESITIRTTSSTATWPASPITMPPPMETSSATSSSITSSDHSSASEPGAESAAFAGISR